MNKVEQVTDSNYQQQEILLEDGTSFNITMYYVSLQQGWFIEKLSYGDFVLQGLRITNSPNMLQQFRNKIPFGLACFSKDDREPSLQTDFSSGASQLYVLTAADVRLYTEVLSGQATA